MLYSVYGLWVSFSIMSTQTKSSDDRTFFLTFNYILYCLIKTSRLPPQQLIRSPMHAK